VCVCVRACVRSFVRSFVHAHVPLTAESPVAAD